MRYVMIFLCLIAFDRVNLAHGKPGDPVAFGLQATMPTDPYPTMAGFGANLSFLDLLRLEAHFGAGQLLAVPIGITAYSYGGGVKLRIPHLSVSPILGVSISRNHIDDSTWSKQKTRPETFLSPLAGIEFRPGSGYFGLGVFAPYKRSDGAFKKDPIRVGTVFSRSEWDQWILPFLYTGYIF